MIDKLGVHLWGREVGFLVPTKDRYRTRICFYFDEDFATDGWDVAPLRAPLKCRAVQSGLPFYGEAEKKFGGLPSFIADSLPDHWGNRVFAEWAKARGIRQRDLSPLDRLAYIGRRGMGALEFLPVMDEAMENPFKVEIEDLYCLAQTAMNEAREFKVGQDNNLLIENLFKVGTSAGGRRPKALVNVNWEADEYYSGQVATALPWFTPMIIKFDERTNVPTTRIEYSYYLIAHEIGLRIMPSHLSIGKDAAHFMTERFDRNWNEKIHIQTLAAMRPGARSYEDLFEVAGRLSLSQKELRQLFLNMTLNVLAGNVDDHNKNFSFMMDKDGRWHAAPAYDFTFTVDLSAPGYVNRQSMTVNGKNEDIGRDDLLEIARRYNVKGAAGTIARAANTVADYRKHAAQAGISTDWADRIQREIDSRIAGL